MGTKPNPSKTGLVFAIAILWCSSSKAKKVISDFNTQFNSVDKLSKETLEPIVNELIRSNDTNFKGVGQPLRIALTGSKFGPGIYDIIISLGKDEVTKRLTNKKLG